MGINKAQHHKGRKAGRKLHLNVDRFRLDALECDRRYEGDHEQLPAQQMPEADL